MGNKKLLAVQWPPPHLNNHRDFNDLLMCKLLLPPTPLLNQELNVQKGKFIIKLNMIFKEVNCQWTTIFFALASKLLTLPAWSLELLMVSLIWINYFWSSSRQLVCQLIFFSMWRSRGLMWELGTSLGSDKLIRKWLREFCMPTTTTTNSQYGHTGKNIYDGKKQGFHS